MKLLSRSVFSISLMIAVCSGLLAAEARLTAEESVERYINSILLRANELRSYYETDRNYYFSEIESALTEFVDFREVARGVMAKYGTGPNGANDEQLSRFSEVFKASMVDFYGSALASYGGEKFEILENSRPPSDPENATNIRMMVAAEDGSRFELQYTMFLNDEGIWKLKNLYVEGVNLRRQYYSRFDSLVSSNGYDIDKVIDSW